GRSFSRLELAEMFCADSQDPAGSLRWHLSRIRRTVNGEALLITGDHVSFNRAAGAVDLDRFGRLPDILAAPDALPALNELLALYRGEFLAQLNLPGEANFEFWLLAERARYQQLYERGLRAAIHHNMALAAYERAREQAQQLLQVNPLLEEGHALLMQLYVQLGQQETALAQYAHCRQLLAAELAVEPSPELTALHEQIRAGELARWAGQPLLTLTPSPTATASQIDLVGRDSEMERLATAWQRGEVVTVTGVAGAGKSALVEQFAASLTGARLLRGDCYESTATLPFRPWLDIVEGLLALLPDRQWEPPYSFWLDQLASVSPLLAARRGGTATPLPPASQQHLFTAFAELLLQTPGLPPLLVFIDDLQWADESSMQLLPFFAGRAGRREGTPLLLVTAFRSEEVEDNPLLPTILRDLGRAARLATIELPALGPQEVDELIRQMWPALPPGFRSPHVRDRLLSATAGNPLFLTEVLRELAEAEKLPEEMPIPPRLQELVERRLVQLAESGRQVAEALAVLEQPADLGLIQQVSGRSEDEVAAALDAGLRWRLLRGAAEAPAGRYDFAHDLLRAAVIDQISGIRRQLLHRRAARSLSQRVTAAAKIAYHWQLAADQEQEAIWWQKAGDEAARIYANNDAERYYERALTLSHEPAARARLILSLVDIYLIASRWNEGLARLEASKDEMERADSDYWRGRWQQRQGNLLYQQGDYEAALVCLTQAQGYFDASGALLEQAQVAGAVGSIYWRRAQFDEALAAMRQKQEIAEELGDLRLEAEALGGIGAVLTQQDEWAASLEMQQLALARARQSNDPLRVGKLQGNIGVTYARQKKYQEAAEYFLQQYLSDSKLGDEAGMANSIGNLGTVYRMFGQFGLARACAKVRLDVALNLQDRRALAIALGDIGATYLDEEQPEAALPYLERAIAVGEFLQARFLLCSYHHFVAQCWWQQGEQARALAAMREALTGAAAIQRQDVLFQAKLHLIKYRLGTGESSTGEAGKALAELLTETTDERSQAQIQYELWLLDKTQNAYREAALPVYQALFATAPEHSLQAPLAEMLGQPIAGDVSLPGLPRQVFVGARTLTALLAEVDALLPRLLHDPDQ
ncbi:MAG: AAA family ATPase, partial [Anaerolineales bacterium]|nr:AAA family ATPase [Anaerolineales bacterium]